MSVIRALRRTTWRASSVLGDIEAAQDAMRDGSPAPLARRLARKEIYKAEGRATRRLLRKIGL